MTATDYADTVRPTLEAVAQLGVPVKVILPSYIYGTDTSWMDTLYQRIPNLNSLFYAFADHPYWYGHDPAQTGANGPVRADRNPARADDRSRRRVEADRHHRVRRVDRQLRRRVRQRGGPGPAPAGDAECRRQPHRLGDRDVPRLPARDRGTESTDREEQFGLLREDDTPKPAYSILRAAMQQYRG